VPENKRQRFSTCYFAKDGQIQIFDPVQRSIYYQPPQLESGGAGLVGTAGDYLRFCRMLLGGGALDGVRILSPKTVALMTSNHLPGGREMTAMMPMTETFNEAGYDGLGFGLGVSVTLDPVRARIPGSAGEFSWGGAAGTYFFVDPKEDLVVVFMMQVLTFPQRIRMRRDLRTLVYSAMTESYA